MKRKLLLLHAASACLMLAGCASPPVVPQRKIQESSPMPGSTNEAYRTVFRDFCGSMEVVFVADPEGASAGTMRKILQGCLPGVEIRDEKAAGKSRGLIVDPATGQISKIVHLHIDEISLGECTLEASSYTAPLAATGATYELKREKGGPWKITSRRTSWVS